LNPRVLFRQVHDAVDQRLSAVERRVDRGLARIEHFYDVLPARVWNLIVWVVAVWLQIAWIAFLFGSVAGVVLVLIFAPELFLLPLGLLIFLHEIPPLKE